MTRDIEQDRKRLATGGYECTREVVDWPWLVEALRDYMAEVERLRGLLKGKQEGEAKLQSQLALAANEVERLRAELAELNKAIRLHNELEDGWRKSEDSLRAEVEKLTERCRDYETFGSA